MTDPHATYDAFARRIVATGVLSDPWIDGAPRFRQAPVILTAAEQRALYRAAEDVAAVYDEVCLIVADDAAISSTTSSGSRPSRRRCGSRREPLWHGIARADVFVTDEGLAFTELNCDTPTGEAEAVVLSALAAEDRPGLVDPNRDLERALPRHGRGLGRALVEPGRPRAVGHRLPHRVHRGPLAGPALPALVRGGGCDVVLGSPYNLGARPDGARAALRSARRGDAAPLQDRLVGRARERVGRRGHPRHAAARRAARRRAARRRSASRPRS